MEVPVDNPDVGWWILDGRIALPAAGRSSHQVPPAIANARDWRLFQELAAQADLLITSARYFRQSEDQEAQLGHGALNGTVSDLSGSLLGIIDEILESDKAVRRKQRHTAQRIFERLKEEGRLLHEAWWLDPGFRYGEALFLTEQDILDYCRDNLTGYKRPKHVEFRDELPKTNVGKILRRALRD